MLVSLAGLGACSTLEGVWQQFSALVVTPTLPAHAQSTPTPTLPVQAVTPSRVVPPPEAMVLWLPPEFDPANGSPAGDVLLARLEQFEGQNDVAGGSTPEGGRRYGRAA